MSKKNAKSEAYDRIRLLLVAMGMVLGIVGFALFAAPFVTAGSGNLTLNYSGYEYALGDLQTAALTTAWVLSLIAMVLAIGCFALLLLNYFGIVKIDVAKGMLALVLGGLFAVLAIVPGIMMLCTIPIVGANADYFGPGPGAIIGGVCMILSGLSVCCGFAYPVIKA